jgi:hypothetical protein
MSNLTVFLKQLQDEFRVDTTGKVFTSIRGAARLADVDDGGISKSLKSATDEKPRPLALFLVQEGFKPADLLEWGEVGIPDIGLGLILEYYGYECQERYRTELAKQCCRAFRSVGIRAWIQKELDWEKPKSTADMLIIYAQAFKEHEERMSRIEQQNTEIKHQLEAIDMETAANTAELERFSNGHGFWTSIAGWCKTHDIKQSTQWMSIQGRKASALCKQKGLKPVPIRDPRYGEVNTYPDSILAELTWD